MGMEKINKRGNVKRTVTPSGGRKGKENRKGTGQESGDSGGTHDFSSRTDGVRGVRLGGGGDSTGVIPCPTRQDGAFGSLLLGRFSCSEALAQGDSEGR